MISHSNRFSDLLVIKEGLQRITGQAHHLESLNDIIEEEASLHGRVCQDRRLRMWYF
jgi:hypothetical protein